MAIDFLGIKSEQFARRVLALLCAILSINALTAPRSSLAQTPPVEQPLQVVPLNTRPSETSSTPKLSAIGALDIADLKLEMAESAWKARPSLRALTDLVNALENHLNKSCFGDLMKTLSYSGSPTNPDCIAKMERLLDIYPNNPVAVCLRDGIESPSCSDAYREQSMKRFSSSTSSLDKIPDPALKVGLSAKDRERLKAINETIAEINKDFSGAEKDMERNELRDEAMRLYDQAMSVACKIVAIELEDPVSPKDEDKPVDDPSIREIREKLLKIPPALRAEYQEKLLSAAEEELAKAKNSDYHKKIALRKIEVIKNPNSEKPPTGAGKLRYRVVLPECYDLVGQATVMLPDLPSPVCHRDGWQSPQCLISLKKWREYRAKFEEMKRRDKALNAPTPSSQISSF